MTMIKRMLLLAALVPCTALAGVIYGNVTTMANNKEKAAGDTLRVILLSDGKSITPEVAANPEKAGAKIAIIDTTDAYSAFNIYVDGAGAFRLYLYGKTKDNLLAEPLKIQVYEEPVEYNLVLTKSQADGAVKGYQYTLRRK